MQYPENIEGITKKDYLKRAAKAVGKWEGQLKRRRRFLIWGIISIVIGWSFAPALIIEGYATTAEPALPDTLLGLRGMPLLIIAIVYTVVLLVLTIIWARLKKDHYQSINKRFLDNNIENIWCIPKEAWNSKLLKIAANDAKRHPELPMYDILRTAARTHDARTTRKEVAAGLIAGFTFSALGNMAVSTQGYWARAAGFNVIEHHTLLLGDTILGGAMGASLSDDTRINGEDREYWQAVEHYFA